MLTTVPEVHVLQNDTIGCFTLGTNRTKPNNDAARNAELVLLPNRSDYVCNTVQ